MSGPLVYIYVNWRKGTRFPPIYNRVYHAVEGNETRCGHGNRALRTERNVTVVPEEEAQAWARRCRLCWPEGRS